MVTPPLSDRKQSLIHAKVREGARNYVQTDNIKMKMMMFKVRYNLMSVCCSFGFQPVLGTGKNGLGTTVGVCESFTSAYILTLSARSNVIFGSGLLGGMHDFFLIPRLFWGQGKMAWVPLLVYVSHSHLRAV